MKTKKHIHLLATAALLALAACTQDETAIPTGETHERGVVERRGTADPCY